MGELWRLWGPQAHPAEPMCCSLHQKLLWWRRGAAWGALKRASAGSGVLTALFWPWGRQRCFAAGCRVAGGAGGAPE